MAKNIAAFYEEVLTTLLDYKRKKAPNLTFGLRKQNNKQRLDKGYWFQGASWYLLMPFYKKMDWRNKTATIGMVCRIDELGETF
jgi:hypothetical protein